MTLLGHKCFTLTGVAVVLGLSSICCAPQISPATNTSPQPGNDTTNLNPPPVGGSDAGTPSGGDGGAVGDGGLPTTAGMAAFQSFHTYAVSLCGGCHSEKLNEGVLVPQNPLFASNNVAFAYSVAKPFVNFSNPATSLIAIYAGNNHCGIPSVCGSGSAATAAAIQSWVSNDSPLPQVAARVPVTDAQTLTLINQDLQAQPPATQPFMHYFTIEYTGNFNGQPPLVSADTERSALIKMLNLLSTMPQIVQPTPIDGDKMIYRIDMRTLGWTNAAWSNLKNLDPYFAPKNFTATATAAYQTARSDWFVTNIPNSGVNAYFEFLGINSDDPTIDSKNTVNRFADMAAGYPATIRSGFTVSRTENFNRILSWHATSSLGSAAVGSGHLFKSYNMDSDANANIFAQPYRPTTNFPANETPGPYDFTYGDSDNISTLPNGLNFYYTVEHETGAVQSVASQGCGFPGPTFCFQCHDNNTNMIPFVDQVHDVIAADPVGTFPAALSTLLVGMYNNAALNQKVAAAGAIFANAYAELKLPALDIAGTPSGYATEVMNIVHNNYNIGLPVQAAAAELGTTVAQLIAVIKGSTTLSLQLASLTTADANGNFNGVIRRDVWEGQYAAVRTALFP